MTKIYLICGYGIPKDIMNDFEYKVYLNLAFNKIYDATVQAKPQSVKIIFSGGNTDLFPPHKRNEADEMIKLFVRLMERPFVNNITKNWQLVAEKKALSTLENLLFAKEIITSRKINDFKLEIICSLSKENIVKVFGKAIFESGTDWKVKPIDFYNTPKRYVDMKSRKIKEKGGIGFGLWALENTENMGVFRGTYEEKLEFKRNRKDISGKEMTDWWRKKFRELGI